MPDSLDDLAAAILKAEGWRRSDLNGVVEFSVPQSAGRVQAVRLQGFVHEGESLVRFVSTVGKKAELSETRYGKALEVNFRLPYGHLALDGDYLVLVETRPLKTTTPATSAQVIRYLAKQADYYEKAIFGKDVF